jgi:hypothetical protein
MTNLIDSYKKSYIYSENGYKSQDGLYTHPTVTIHKIDLGSKYADGYYPNGIFDIEFLAVLNADDKGHKTNDGLPFAGTVVNLKLEHVNDLRIIAQAISKHQARLDLHSRDEHLNVVTALRAAGYRKGYVNRDIARITEIS